MELSLSCFSIVQICIMVKLVDQRSMDLVSQIVCVGGVRPVPRKALT